MMLLRLNNWSSLLDSDCNVLALTLKENKYIKKYTAIHIRAKLFIDAYNKNKNNSFPKNMITQAYTPYVTILPSTQETGTVTPSFKLGPFTSTFLLISFSTKFAISEPLGRASSFKKKIIF